MVLGLVVGSFLRVGCLSAITISFSPPSVSCLWRVFLQLPPSAARSSFPGLSVDVKGPHVSLTDILESQVQAAMASLSHSMSFRMWPSSVRWTWLNQCSRHYLSRVYMVGRPARDRTLTLVTWICPRCDKLFLGRRCWASFPVWHMWSMSHCHIIQC